MSSKDRVRSGERDHECQDPEQPYESSVMPMALCELLALLNVSSTICLGSTASTMSVPVGCLIAEQ